MPEDLWYRAFLERLRELKNEHIIHVAQGSAADHSEYRKLCGVIEGIAICEREFKEILAKVTGDEDAGDFTDVKKLNL